MSITTNTTAADYLKLLETEDYAIQQLHYDSLIGQLSSEYSKEYDQVLHALIGFDTINDTLSSYSMTSIFWTLLNNDKKCEFILQAVLARMSKHFETFGIPESYLIAAYIDNYKELNRLMSEVLEERGGY